MASIKPVQGAPQRFVRISPELRDSREIGPRNFRRGGAVLMQMYPFTGCERLCPGPCCPRAPAGHARPGPNGQTTLVIKIRTFFRQNCAHTRYEYFFRHIEIWGSILDYFFINHTLRPGTLARRSPFRSSRQPAELLSEVNSLHRITSPLSKLPCLATPLN